MFFKQQFSEKVDPIKKALADRTVKLQNTIKKLSKTQNEVERVDRHYDGICKAILQTTGFQVKDLNSHSIYQEHTKMVR